MALKPKILGLIPARAGSKGVPDKNIRLLAGKPLIHYTIEAALKSQYLDTICVSSDIPNIAEICSVFPEIEIPFIRPSSLSLDVTPMIEVIQHALNFYSENGRQFDFVCLLQPTFPIRKLDLIDKAIQKIIETGADSLTSIQKIPSQYNPHWAFTMDNNEQLSISTGDKTLITRRQDLPDCWYRDGQIYITSSELIGKGVIIGDNCIGLINDHALNVNIDTWEDWLLAEKLLSDAGRP